MAFCNGRNPIIKNILDKLQDAKLCPYLKIEGRVYVQKNSLALSVTPNDGLGNPPLELKALEVEFFQ